MQLSAISLALTRQGAPKWSESALWPTGTEPGLWIDPSYTPASFQDSAGTTPISAIGTLADSSNPVGLQLDRKWGATAPADPGLHLSQATSAARPFASARKNVLVATATLSTQSVTVIAAPYTISFTGGGTVTGSGAYAGALTNGQTFTPTAGSLTLTVAGSVTLAQLEQGSSVTSYQAVVSDADYNAAGFPIYDKFDGTDDALLSATVAAGVVGNSNMDCLIAVRRDSAARGVLMVQDATHYFGYYEVGIGGVHQALCGSPTVWVDNVQLAGGTSVQAQTIDTALSPGAWHVIEFRGLDLSAWTAIAFSNFAAYLVQGDTGGIMLFPAASAADRDKARTRLAAKVGLVL